MHTLTEHFLELVTEHFLELIIFYIRQTRPNSTPDSNQSLFIIYLSFLSTPKKNNTEEHITALFRATTTTSNNDPELVTLHLICEHLIS